MAWVRFDLKTVSALLFRLLTNFLQLSEIFALKSFPWLSL